MNNNTAHKKDLKAELIGLFLLLTLCISLSAQTQVNRDTRGAKTTAPSTKRQVIILKGDDLLPSPTWQRFTNYIETKNLKASLGLVCENLYDDTLTNWIKTLLPKNNFEIWNHGFAHFCIDGNNPGEFNGSTYEEQLYYLKESQRLYKEKLGVTCLVFGTPCNQKDNNTTRALLDIDEIDVWYYGRTDTNKLEMTRVGNIEIPTGEPNYEDFTQKYAQDNLAKYDYLLLQLHPGWWNDNNWDNFEKIIAFLKEKNVVFMNPSEYYQAITDTFTVTTTADGGPGSLRDAIKQANSNVEKNAVIILPAGIYSLTGAVDENNNLGGDLDIMSNIIIRGVGASATIIDGSGNDRVFHVMDGRVTLTGMTIRNGLAHYGGGCCVEGGDVAITHCTMTGNRVNGSGGGAIYAQNASITISGCTITNNSGTTPHLSKGGGIWINFNNWHFVDVRNCLISGNTANTNSLGQGQGGGLYVQGPYLNYQSHIFNNTFKNNKAASGGKGEGGGLYIQQAKDLWLDRNHFEANQASENGQGSGGAVAVEDWTNLIIMGNRFTGNGAGLAGSGLFLDKTSKSGKINCTMINNTLVNNSLVKNGAPGEGIYVGHNVVLNLTNNLISGHSKGIRTEPLGTSTIAADTNLFYNSSDPVTGTHAILLPPALDAHFKPTPNSPAIDAGKTMSTVIKDLAGTVFPLGNGYDIGCYESTPSTGYPGFSLDQTTLNYYRKGIDFIDSHTIQLTKTGAGTLNWKVELNCSWLKASPTSGQNSGAITINTNSNGLPLGLSTATVTIRDPNNPASTKIVDINLILYAQGSSEPPFGSFDTPIHETSNVSGSIPVTGWALDENRVTRVEICYEPAPGNPLQYIGDAVFVEGARPDVALKYPTYPNNTRAGWGYMLLTNMLPGGGNGVYPLYVRITDIEGNVVVLGPRTITVDNLHATKPFGAIDTPAQGGSVSGKTFVNFGWALTPQPNIINTDGSTIKVWVDSVNLGSPIYNIYREDIATLFPDYANSGAAIGYFKLDTTAYTDGVHTIQWTVTDSAGNSDGIGSRYFTIANNQYRAAQVPRHDFVNPAQLPLDTRCSVYLKQGFSEMFGAQELLPDNQGILQVRIKELEHIQLHIGKDVSLSQGYMIDNHGFKPLPVGATLDIHAGTFYWTPGPGFIGSYPLVFVVTDPAGQTYKKRVTIIIEPKYLP